MDVKNMHGRTSPLWQTDEFICYVVDHDDAKLPVKTEGGRTETANIGSALVVVVRGQGSERIYRSHIIWPRSAAIEKALSQAELWRAEFADRLDDSRPIWPRTIAVEPRTCAQCSAVMHPITRLGP